jgi:hypothetical protein
LLVFFFVYFLAFFPVFVFFLVFGKRSLGLVLFTVVILDS